PELAQERLTQVTTQVQSIQEELDQIIQQLRPASLQDKGLAAALADLTQQWSKQTNIPITYTAHEATDLPLHTEQSVYRIVQEALQNVSKHAAATAVTITLRYGETAVTVTINDNGSGFDPAAPIPTTSHGLSNMNHRTNDLNGTLTITSNSTQGTTITTTIPR
ncbi:MAG: histidine kinase, partial [Chloroflexi bacterium]|nr:histidine kinase [Chloroflexota bacterium]